MLVFSEGDNGRTADVRIGELVRLILAENAASGYRWALERCDEDRLTALAPEPRYAAASVGSAGEVSFDFQPTRAGTAEIVLKYWRHWEGDASVVRWFRLYLNIRP